MTYSDSVKRTRATEGGREEGVDRWKIDVLAKASPCRFSVFSKYSRMQEPYAKQNDSQRNADTTQHQ